MMNEDRGNVIKRIDLIFLDDVTEILLDSIRFRQNETKTTVVPSVGDSVELRDRYYQVTSRHFKYTPSKEFWVFVDIELRVKEI